MLVVKRIVFPSGSICGHRWDVSPAALSNVVMACGFPPVEDTRMIGELFVANTIVSSWDQLPPPPERTSASVIGTPPFTETFFNLPSAKNAIHRLLGEKKAESTPSVSASGAACN